MDRHTIRRLRGEPGYVRFVGAATLARVADEMFGVAAVLLVLERTGSAAFAGALVAAITLPSIVSAPLLGAWLDMRGRRRGLMIADQAIAVGVLVFVVLATGNLPDAVLIGVTALAGITWPLSFGGMTSLIPVLVRGDLLTPANAVEATSFNVALIAGPLLAGAVAAVFGPAEALMLEAALTAAALLLIAGLRDIDRAPAHGGRLLATARAGLRALASVPPLRGITLAGGLSLMGAGVLTVAFPLWCVEDLDAARSGSGLLWGAFAVGSSIGALSLVGIQARFPAQRIVLLSLVISGALMALWPLAGSLPVALALVAVAAVADGPGLAATFAVRQEWAPADLQGQIFTTAAGLKVGSFAIGSALAGPIVVGVGAAEALLVAAGMHFVGAAVGALALRGRTPAGALAGHTGAG